MDNGYYGSNAFCIIPTICFFFLKLTYLINILFYIFTRLY